MPAEHLEIERKFEVPPDFRLPELNGIPGVATVFGPEERRLDAVYHDTADLRLAAARVTLRRRTGGPDAGWHLKLPAEAGARRELSFPLGRATRTPPKAVQAPVRGLLRGGVPAQVARLQTLRLVTVLSAADGRTLAEVADDTVTGTAVSAGPGEPATVESWREIEVELVDGNEALLQAVSDALLRAGARPSSSPSKLARVLDSRIVVPSPDGRPVLGRSGRRGPVPTAGEVVVAAVRQRLQDLQRADLAVRTGGEDGVHDLRVACRRLRSIFAAFRSVLDRERTDPLREELRTVGLRLSPARDGEVALEHLRRLAAGQPPELVLGPVAARLQQAQQKDALDGQAATARALDDPVYLRLLDDLVELSAAPPLTPLADRPAPGVLRAALRKQGKRYRRSVAAAQAGGHGAALHEVRKAAKRLRYTAEVAEPVVGRRARRVRKQATRLQDVLGERQDTLITRELCRTIGRAAFGAGENAWTYGHLHGLEEARATRAEDAFWRGEAALEKALRRAVSSS